MDGRRQGVLSASLGSLTEYADNTCSVCLVGALENMFA